MFFNLCSSFFATASFLFSALFSNWSSNGSKINQQCHFLPPPPRSLSHLHYQALPSSSQLLDHLFSYIPTLVSTPRRIKIIKKQLNYTRICIYAVETYTSNSISYLTLFIKHHPCSLGLFDTFRFGKLLPFSWRAWLWNLQQNCCQI